MEIKGFNVFIEIVVRNSIKIPVLEHSIKINPVDKKMLRKYEDHYKTSSSILIYEKFNLH